MTSLARYAVIDTETGGLPGKDGPLEQVALTQISCLVLDADLNILDQCEHKLKPAPGAICGHYVRNTRRADGSLMYDEELWQRQGLSLEIGTSTLNMFFNQFFGDRKAIAVAHNAYFDWQFVKQWMPSIFARTYTHNGTLNGAPVPGYEVPPTDWTIGFMVDVYGWINTRGLLHLYRKRTEPTYSPRGKGVTTLAALAKIAGVEQSVAHDALSDTRDVVAGLRFFREKGMFPRVG